MKNKRIISIIITLLIITLISSVGFTKVLATENVSNELVNEVASQDDVAKTQGSTTTGTTNTSSTTNIGDVYALDEVVTFENDVDGNLFIMGKDIMINNVTVNGDINLQALINWTRYVACAMKMIKVVLPHFSEVILAEFIENNFLFKIKKSSDSKSIGFLFTLLEKEKDACEITEYSIQQTSLEQIFNKFAENQGKTEEDIKNSEKVVNDININDKLVNDLIH